MTLRAAEQGRVELISPEGGRVMLEFRGQVAEGPDVEATLDAIMLAAESTGGEVCQAIANYARIEGLTARYYLGRDAIFVALGSSPGVAIDAPLISDGRAAAGLPAASVRSGA